MDSHARFATTSRGLDRDLPPMRLFEKAKRFGTWNPSEIDFTQDRADWQRLDPLQQDVILRLTSLFQAGEEAVTLDLLPLMMVIAQEGRVEEELFLTSFLYDEAKHTDFFRRFLDEVTGVSTALEHYHLPNYRTIFYEALPAALHRLRHDTSTEAQLKAAVTYNLIVEGVLAETGYHAYFSMLSANHILPGQRQGVALLKQDESRHIAYGIFLISRLIAAEDRLWQVAQDTMNELIRPAIGVIQEMFESYDSLPFGLALDEFTNFAISQFNARLARIEKARGASPTELQESALVESVDEG